MTGTTIKQIAELYGLHPKSIMSPQSGYRNQSWRVKLNDGSVVNIIVFKNEPDIVERMRRADKVAQAVAKQLPARVPLSPKMIRLDSGFSIRYAGLYNYLPGDTIPWEAYTAKHIKLLGQTMAKLHSDTDALDCTGLQSVAQEYSNIVDRMTSYFGGRGVTKALEAKLGLRLDAAKLGDYARILEQCDSLKGQRALHMDLVRSNILFGGDGNELQVSGVLDFEKVAWGSPLFDIARSLAFLLVDCKFKTEDDVRRYFLASGYTKRGGRKVPGISVVSRGGGSSLLEVLVDLFLLHDFYKFLRHNPYESLPKNLHFVRTIKQLQKRHLITVVDEITWPQIKQE